MTPHTNRKKHDSLKLREHNKRINKNKARLNRIKKWRKKT